MELIRDSIEKVGYEVYIWRRGPFRAFGFTTIFPPGDPKGAKGFWDEVIADGRLGKLRECSSVPTNLLGASTWDEEVPKNGYRYTICIEETEHTDFAALSKEYALHEIRAGATDWMCFKITFGRFKERFWRKDNAYKMMKVLGYEFNVDSYDSGFYTGFHFDVYPPGLSFPLHDNDEVGFWITVKKP